MHDMIDSIYSLSPLQQGLLFHSVSQPDATEYFIQAHLEFRGELNLRAFEAAWTDVLERHSILRTAFAWEGLDSPLQVVQRHAELPLTVEDWRDRDETELEAVLEQDAREGFNLEQAPLMRFRLFRLEDHRWQLLWSYHHLLLDGWSVGLLISDWLNRYGHHDCQPVPALSAPAPFSDYMAWLDKQDQEQMEAFWRSQLEGFTSPTPLPQLDPLPGPVEGLPYGEQTLDIRGQQWQALQPFCQHHGLTLNTLLQGAWGLLLGSLAGRREALFGVTVSGRPDTLADADAMVGLFINTLPLRLQWDADTTVADWLTRLHTLNGDLHHYEYSPLVRLKAQSDIPGDAALFESIFVFENFPFDEDQSALGDRLSFQPLDEGRVVDGVRQTRGRNSYPLSLIASVESDSLQLLLSYQRQRFSTRTITLLLGHLEQLLHAFVTQADRPVTELDWVSGEDWQQQQQWGQGEQLALPAGSVGERFAQMAAAFPERQAVGDEHTMLTYAELDSDANRLAREYLALGLEPGDTLALALPRSVEGIVALVAALKAGLTYVPLDSGQPPARLAAIVADSGARLLLTSASLLPALTEALTANSDTAAVKPVALEDRREQITGQPATPPALPTADATAYLVYTSGSTGTPKGVAVSHRAVLAYTLGILHAVPLPDPCRFASVSTLAADLGNTQLFGALLSGGYLYLVDDNTRFDPAALASLLEQQRIDVLKLTPGHLQGLLTALPDSRLLPRHSLLLGGEALDKGLLERIRNLAPALAVYNHYGPSEATVGALLHPVKVDLACQAGASTQLPLGRPQPNRQIRILDKAGRALPSGVPGELCLGGEGLASGYHRRPALTDERFVTLAESGDRFYRTGDQARWLSDGSVGFLGRQDNQVKIRGYRVELDEVAHHLSQMSGRIRRAVVRLWQEHGQEQSRPARLVAYLVAEGDLNIRKLKHDLGQQLPDYMVPDDVVLLDQIPVTANGKVDYRQLPAPVSDTGPEGDHQPPRTETEIILAQIWRDLLQRDAINVHDNFFALGGDSIMLLQVIARAQQQGLALTPVLAFKHRTLAALAAAIDGDNLQPEADGIPEQSPDLPLSPGQHHRLEHTEMQPLWCLLQLRRPLEERDLAAALGRLRQHYYPFTLNQPETGGWALRLSQAQASTDVPLTSVSNSDMQAPEKLVQPLFETMQASAQPWLGAALSEGYLLLCAHPLALDSAAWPMLLDDLARLYGQDPDSQPVLAASGRRLLRYLETEQQRAQSDDLEPAWEYWLEHAGLDLPAPATPPKAAPTELPLTPAMQTSIRDLVTSHAATPLSLVTAALAFLLGGQQEGGLSTLALAVSAGRPELATMPSTAPLSRAGIDPGHLPGALDFPAPIILQGLNGDPLHDWQQVTSQLGAMPQAGADYGLLRYLSDNEYLREPLLTLPSPQAWVRWLGDWDSQMPMGDLVRHHEALPDNMPLVVSVYRLDGALRIQVSAEPSWAEQLADRLASVLTAIGTDVRPPAGNFPLCPDPTALDTLPLDWRQVEDLYPLTPMQHGMVIQSLRATQADYLSQTCLQWDGPLSRDALERAWQQLVDRHPVLRTVFLWRDLEQPLQCVLRQVERPFHWEDLSDLTADRQQRYIDGVLAQERAEPLSLERPPLTWLRVFKLSAQGFVLCHSIHHALSDAWTFGLMLDELLQCYSAQRQRQIPVLPPARPFQHYVRWLGNQQPDTARAFWQRALDGFDTPTPLPFTESALAAETDSSLEPPRRQWVLSVDDTRQLQQFCQHQQVTVNTLVQAAWALLLARYNDRRDVLFGISVAGRPADLDGADTMHGLFIQTLPLRVTLDDDIPLGEWLHTLLDHNLEVRQHEYLSLTEIQRCSQVNADHSLFDSVLVFANAPMDEDVTSRLPDCRIDFIEDRVSTQYPLLIDVIPGSRLELQITFAPDRFRAGVVDSLLERMQQLLRALPRKADARLGELTLLTGDEAQQLAAFNETANDFADCGLPLNSSYPELFARQASRQPDKTAAVCGAARLSYRELDQRSNRLGHVLCDTGARPEQLVALLAERDLPLLTAMIATFKAGAAYMPLDPGLPATRLEQLLALSEAKVMAASSGYREQAAELVAQVQAATGKRLSLCIIEDHWLTGNEAPLPIRTTPESLAYVIFTSGSTGTPKGAMVEHRGMLNNMFGNRISLGLSGDDRVAQTASQAFDISVWQFLAAPLMGATVHILPDDITRDPTALVEAVQEQGITLMELVPTQIRALLAGVDNNAKLDSLRWLQSIGEALPGVLVRDWLLRFPSVPLLNAYGPAECSDNIAWHPLTRIPADLHQPTPVGRPTANNQLYILDSAGRQQPIGVPGEICVAGTSVGRGYWRDPDRTAEVFVEHPFSPGQRFYRTGDLGRMLEDGNIEYLGRRDFQLKLRGQRIEPGEIEACLDLLDPMDKSAVVVVEQKGTPYLVAYWQGPHAVTESSLRDALSGQLPAHLVPSLFIYLEALPQNRNGKVDRKALMQRPVEFARSGSTAARNETEQQLVEIWKALLPVDEFGVEDNFFALGGHSLLATQVLTRIRQRLGVSLPMTALFKHNTVVSLAKVVSQAQRNDADPATDIIPVSRQEPLPLSYAQQRLWFMEQLEGPSGAYNIPVAIKLRGALNRQALQAAMDLLLQRHESLRTGFRMQGDTPRQVIVDGLKANIAFHDLSTLNDLDEAQRQSRAQQLIDEEAERPFDLTAPPMLRVALQRLQEDVHILQFTLHHITADAWSLGVLIREFAQCYEAFAEGAEPSLAALPIQYADYAHWQRSEPQQQRLVRELDYWRQQLQGVPPVFDLPHDNPRPAQADYQGAAISHTLPASQVKALQAYGQGHNATLFMVLLNAFNSLLQRATGKHDFIVGTDIANREHPDLEDLIGFFVNVLPLRAQLSDGESFDDRLARLHDTTLGAYQHQQVPFDKLVEMLQPPRLNGVNPLVQVLFVMQNTPKDATSLAGLELEELEPQGETSKFDLAVFVDERENGDLNMRWLYRTSLFKAETVNRFTQGFLSLLDYLASQSDQTLDRWPWQLSQQRTTGPQTKGMRKKSKMQRLKGIQPARVRQSPVEQVRTSFLDSDSRLPLVVKPGLGELDPVAWAEQSRDWIEEQLQRHGGLLFRGFRLLDAPAFEQFAQAILPDLYGQYGDLPKNKSGRNIYHSTPYPEQHMILFHNESSHLAKWPRKQWFYCEVPASRGGCTPIVDCRKVYQKLPAEILAPLEEKGLLYVRHFTDKLDVRWQDFFKTDDPQQVEARCLEEGMRWQWLEDDGLRIEQRCPAVTAHPDTGEKSFFNQVQLHHESCLEPEVRNNLKALFGPDRLPRNVYYGDGTPIPDTVMNAIGQVYEDCAVRFPWQEGDVAMLDNMLVAHARDPFEGERKICVAMGQMYQRRETSTATGHELTEQQ